MPLHCAATRPKFLNVPSFSFPNPVTYVLTRDTWESNITIFNDCLFSSVSSLALWCRLVPVRCDNQAWGGRGGVTNIHINWNQPWKVRGAKRAPKIVRAEFKPVSYLHSSSASLLAWNSNWHELLLHTYYLCLKIGMPVSTGCVNRSC